VRRKDATLALSHGSSIRLIFIFSVALLPCAAHASGCTKATIAGNYVIETIGEVGSQLSDTLFLVASDGEGTLSGTGAVDIGGAPSTGVTMKGTYTVKSNCWFTSTTTDSLNNIFTFQGQILQNGAAISGISTTTGTYLQYNAYRQSVTTCSAVSPGTWPVYGQYFLTPFGPFVATSQWVVTKAGHATITQEANLDGTASSSKGTATIVLNSNCTFTWTVENGEGSTFHAFGVGGINQNGIAALAIATNAGWVDTATQFE